MYRLKSNVADFTVVDGKYAGRTYRAGETYEEVPPEEKNKFEAVKPEGLRAGKPEVLKADEEGGKKK